MRRGKLEDHQTRKMRGTIRFFESRRGNLVFSDMFLFLIRRGGVPSGAAAFIAIREVMENRLTTFG
jgi:predicted aconitase with swiveling domain